jgi:hypothetical protein
MVRHLLRPCALLVTTLGLGSMEAAAHGTGDLPRAAPPQAMQELLESLEPHPFPRITDGRGHCPHHASRPSGTPEGTTHGDVGSLRTVSLFVHDTPFRALLDLQIKTELICGYDDGFERILETSSVCRVVNSDMPSKRSEQFTPRTRVGFSAVCDVANRSTINECDVRCEP